MHARRPATREENNERNINIIGDDARGKKSEKEERRRKKKSESEDKFLADPEEAFQSHVTYYQENTPAPRQRGSKNIANPQVRAGWWRARKGYNHESQSLKRLIEVTKSKLEPLIP